VSSGIVARCLGMDSKRSNPLWKDHALLALNEAVLHSYKEAGVRMTDHHSEGKRYMDFVERERAEGRQPSGDWSWLTPPQAAPASPVFHMRMEDHHPVPNFYRDRGTDGKFLRPDYSDVDRWRHAPRWDRIRYRWRRWRHQRDGFKK
jgi:nitric-oxide synthase